MIEPKTIEVDNLSFYLQPMRPLKAIRLDKQIISLIVPALKGLGDMSELSLDTEIDFGKLFEGISEALQNMDGDTFEKFLQELFATVSFLESGKSPEELSNDAIINRVFQGESLMTMYKLAFEIMKFNKFTPFEMVGVGNVVKQINTLNKGTKKANRSGKKSGTLVP